jgi:type IV secretory pathway protease TraF
MNWLQGLLNIFNISHNQNAPLESRYYGPYDSLYLVGVTRPRFNFIMSMRHGLL